MMFRGTSKTSDENSSSRANAMNEFASSLENRTTKTTAPIRHYEVPNLTSMLYEYTNREKDTVESAFRGGNYQTIRNLPDDIRPYSVGQAVRNKIAETALTASIIS